MVKMKIFYHSIILSFNPCKNKEEASDWEPSSSK
jgi:hypothetical protein